MPEVGGWKRELFDWAKLYAEALTLIFVFGVAIGAIFAIASAVFQWIVQ